MGKTLFRALVLVVGFTALVHAEDKFACGDFLALLHQKPKQLEFLSCTAHPDRQTKPLDALYRVRGADTAVVERSLSAAFGMKKIVNRCCVWEPEKQSGFVARDGRRYELWMGTDETLIHQRDQWKKIPYFYVDVELATEEP